MFSEERIFCGLYLKTERISYPTLLPPKLCYTSFYSGCLHWGHEIAIKKACNLIQDQDIYCEDEISLDVQNDQKKTSKEEDHGAKF